MQPRLGVGDMFKIERALRPVLAELQAARGVDGRDRRQAIAPGPEVFKAKVGISAERIEDAGGKIVDRRIVIAGRGDDGLLDLSQPFARLQEFALARRLCEIAGEGDAIGCSVSIAASAASRRP